MSHFCEERRHAYACRLIDMIISSKFGVRKPIYLIILRVVDEAIEVILEVILKRFIGNSSLPICLWMVSSRERKLWFHSANSNVARIGAWFP
jgi:hypothetical protein